MCIVHYIGGLKTACNNSLLGDALREAPGEGGWRDNVPITGCNSSQVQNICQRSCPLACSTQGKKKHSSRHSVKPSISGAKQVGNKGQGMLKNSKAA